MNHRWLVFKSIRGLARPWLVFSPSDRHAPREVNWDEGFTTWQDAIGYVNRLTRPVTNK